MVDHKLAASLYRKVGAQIDERGEEKSVLIRQNIKKIKLFSLCALKAMFVCCVRFGCEKLVVGMHRVLLACSLEYRRGT